MCFRLTFPFHYRFMVVFFLRVIIKTTNEWRLNNSQSKTDACNRNNAAIFCPNGCCCHSRRHDLSQAMKAMPNVTVQKKRYRHSTMRACRPLVTFAVTTHNHRYFRPRKRVQIRTINTSTPCWNRNKLIDHAHFISASIAHVKLALWQQAYLDASWFRRQEWPSSWLV